MKRLGKAMALVVGAIALLTAQACTPEELAAVEQAIGVELGTVEEVNAGCVEALGAGSEVQGGACWQVGVDLINDADDQDESSHQSNDDDEDESSQGNEGNDQNEPEQNNESSGDQEESNQQEESDDQDDSSQQSEASASDAQITNADRWNRIAQCESGGRWDYPPVTNSTGTYSGGLMIGHRWWPAYGGEEFAQFPYLASKAQQIVVAERIWADNGARAWDCK